MKMRKIIAVLAAAMLLCAVVPMMTVSVAADGSFNFENGSVSGWQSGCSIAVVEDNGSQVLKFDASGADWANIYYYGSSMVKANTDYTVSLRVKADRNTNMNFKVNNNWAGDTAKWTFNVTTEWQELTYVVNSGACTSGALLLFSSNTTGANGATYYLDDISFVEYVEPVAPGTVANGDFEKGDLSGWEKHQSTAISTDAHSGSYAANIKGNGGWGGMLNQNVTVEAGKTYRISLWAKTNANGANVQIKDGGTSGNNLASTWFTKTVWTNLTWEVIPTTNIICFNFCGGGNGVAEDVLVDDITVTELKPASNDGYITNGDFEIGAETPWTVYSGTAVSAVAAKDGDYGLYIKNPNGGWGGTAYQNFTTEIGKTYVVMMDAKAISNGQNIQIKDNGTTKASKWFTTTSWTTLSFEYTAESTNGMINICGGGTGGNEEIYVDNVFVFVKKAASNDGYIVNGDFETGTTEGLSPSQSTCVSRDAAKDGNFGLKMMGNGGWGGVGLWTINGLEAGATYKFEMDMNAIAQGFNWTLWQDSTNSGSKYASGYFSTTEWTHIEKEFVANSSVAVLNINGGGNGNAETVYLDNLKITLVKPAHTCEFVGVETKAPSCTEDGVMTYSCTCGEGTYTESIPATGHTAGAAADCTNAQVCTVCGAELNAALGHSYESAETKAPTCGEAGVMTYTCACGDSYTEEIPATGAHEYFNDCDTVCMNCYQETREASHNVNHVEAVAPTCNAMGNIEYWYCDVCGQAWLDEACTLNTNRFAVILPMAEEHTYTNEYDIDCNVCGAERSVVAPVIDVKLSISEDVNGLAFRFEANVAGFAVKAGTFVQADYTNATYNGYKLIETGAIATNGVATTTIKGERMCDLDENGKALFAYRIINIPADKLETEITMTPYFIIEIDGEIVTVYGEAQTGAYAEVAIG